MAMRPLLQAGLSTGAGLKKAESSFTASDLQTPSSAVTTLGSVPPHTLRGFRRSRGLSSKWTENRGKPERYGRRAVRPPSGSRAFGGHLAPEAGASHIASAHPKCSLNKSSRSLQLCDFLGNSANAVRWQVWTALLLYVLMRFLCVMSRWGHSFTRLFTLLRATLWRKIDLWDLLSRIMSEIVQHNQMRGISGLAQQGYVKSHRILAKCRCIQDFRRFRNSQTGDLFSRSVLGA